MNEAEKIIKRGIIRIMSHADGRAWMWAMLGEANVYAETFNANASVSAYLQGQRAMGVRLLTQIHTYCPELHNQMQREAQDRIKGEIARQQKTGDDDES